MKSRLFPFVLVLGSCADVDVLTDASGLSSCNIVINQTIPTNGATGVYYRDSIAFVLSNPVPNATIIADFQGTQTVSDDGLTITYTPQSPLEPDTTYTVSLDSCIGNSEISFSTSQLGQAVEENVSLEEQVWRFDPVDGEFVEGDGLVSIMGAIFERELLAAVVAVDGSEMTWHLGVSDEDGEGQDECFRTVEVSGIDFSSAPFFAFYTDHIAFDAYNGVLNFYDFSLDGTISADGTYLGGINYQVTIDVLDLVSVMNLSDVDTMCSHAANLGSPCGPCPEHDASTCATIVARDLYGVGLDTDVVSVVETNAVNGCPQTEN